MSKVILIYANCRNKIAKGDFTFACSIAKDLKKELDATGEDIQIIITSTEKGIKRFREIYPNLNNQDSLLIDEVDFPLYSLEAYSEFNDEVLAYIEANRCKYAQAELIKQVLSPNTKIVFVGNANQPTLSGTRKKELINKYGTNDQPNTYDFISPSDMRVEISGIGEQRIGLPYIKKEEELPPLVSKQPLLKGPYGFMYFINELSNEELAGQYLDLTGLREYIMVGNFEPESYAAIYFSYKISGANLTNHPSLDNRLMRTTVKNATTLVLSTGVMSTLEALLDGKLTFYQYLPNNKNFVESFLGAIQEYCMANTDLIGDFPVLIKDFSKLLFAPKPLDDSQKETLSNYMKNSTLCIRLIEANQAIVESARGKLAPQLLSFIRAPNHCDLKQQASKVCRSLLKKDEFDLPTYKEALLRAVDQEGLREIKILIKIMKEQGQNISFQTENGETLLHLAVKKDNWLIVNFLMLVGISFSQDHLGKTPLDYASIPMQGKMHMRIDSLIPEAKEIVEPEMFELKIEQKEIEPKAVNNGTA